MDAPKQVESLKQFAWKIPPADDDGRQTQLLYRRVIAWSGIVLILLCGLYWLGSGKPLLNSISAHYYTSVHGAFVGILCMLGYSLVCYSGFSAVEKVCAIIGGICAFGVALFPTYEESGDAISNLIPLVSTRTAGNIHNASAGGLFLMFMIFSGVFFVRNSALEAKWPLAGPGWFLSIWKTLLWSLFGKADWDDPRTRGKVKRDGIYRGCALAIFLSFVLILTNALWSFWTYSLIFAEAVSISAFALSWLTKAEQLFGE